MSQEELRKRGNMVIGLILISLGGLFLLSQIFSFSWVGLVWPFFIILPGALFFLGMVMGGKPAGPLAIPGSIISMTGLILLFQSVIGNFESWAYAWALVFPTAVGIGLIVSGAWSSDQPLVQKGIRWTSIGVIMFLVMGAFFELLIFDNRVADILWPLLLIGGGIYLLRRRAVTSPNGKVRAPTIVVERPPAAPAKPPIVPIEPEKPATPPTAFEPIDPQRSKRRRKKDDGAPKAEG